MSKLTSEDNEIIGDSSVETLKGPDVKSHWILWLMLLFLVIISTWAYFSEIDEVTKAKGKVIPSQKVNIIQNFEGGTIEDILVREGETVNKGQELMRIDDTRFSSSYNESQNKTLALKLKVERLNAELENRPFILEGPIVEKFPDLYEHQLDLYTSRRDELDAEIEILENRKLQKQKELQALLAKEEKLQTSYELIQEELAMTVPLVKEGAVSEVGLLRLKRTASNLDGDLSVVKSEQAKVESEILEADKKIEELKISYKTKALTDLSESVATLSAVEESNVALKDRLQRTSIVSPVNGTVKQIHVNTIGGVVTPGMDLIEVVPSDDTLLIEAKLNPADVAFVYPGQDVSVKISAYDYAVYGMLSGKLEHIAADATVGDDGFDFYEIWVRTDQNYLQDEDSDKKLEIIAGMNASVDIITGRKTVLQYLLKPIIKAKKAALTER